MSLDLTDFQFALEGDSDIVVRRDFSHPPAHVWRALTEPELIRQWLGQDSMTRCEMDLRPGGTFHWAWKEFFFSGPILAVDAPHHLTHVEHFNGDTSAGPTIKTDLAARGSGTRMTMVMHYTSAEARTEAIDNGFTDGLDKVYERVESLLTTA